MTEMFRRTSFFSRSSSSRRERLSDSSHELPRWRSPSPMAASMIPPPIVQRTYAPPPSRIMPVRSTMFEQPPVLESREKDLHADLQFLLDAQAQGLLKGLDFGDLEDRRSTGSTTPTTKSVSTRRATRPARRVPGLRSARKGLYNTIVALSSIEDEELRSIDTSVHTQERKVEQIDNWEHKRERLREASSSLDASEETVRSQRLQQEADALQESINEVELQLADMKSRHKKLTRQIAQAENSMQAKLASYTQSMNMLEADVQRFLSSQPSEIHSRPRSSDGQASLWQLPPKRRTLEMAREHFNQEKQSMLHQRERAELEKQALDDGAVMWKEVAVTVTEFEKRMRAEMASAPSLSDSNNAWEEAPTDTPTDRLKSLLVHMDEVIATLQAKYDTAEERHWTLLIAAIGAELDALRKGKQLLESVLPAEPEQELMSNENGSEETDGGDEIHALDKSFETARKRSVSDGDADDEPPPELLFSTHDTDTD